MDEGARMFGSRMAHYFGEYVTTFVYVHIFVMHGSELLRIHNDGLGRWSCEGFEHVNYVLKELRIRSTSHGGREDQK